MGPLERNCSKQISVVNDIYSWEKELEASKTGHKEGSALCSAVKVLANSTSLDIEASKRVLWSMVREYVFILTPFPLFGELPCTKGTPCHRMIL